MTLSRAAFLLVVSAPAGAHACSICNANISYNFFPFTAAWVIIFLGWLAGLAGVYATAERRGRNVTTLQPALKAALKYLGVLLVLYLFGLHLVAILALPVILIVHWWRFKIDPLPLSRAALGALAALIVAVPVSYLVFPRVASEPETRAVTNRYKSEVRALLTAGGSKEISKVPADPFAYTMFDVPVLNVLTQGFGTFYKPLPQPANQSRIIKSDGQYMVCSRGPDGEFSLSEVELADLESSGSVIAAISYDPTNGMISRGDIIITETQSDSR